MQLARIYLRTMGIPLLKGRDFNDQDLAGAPSSVIVNATIADRLWPNEAPIGRRIKIGGLQSTNPWLSVVGIVTDASHRTGRRGQTGDLRTIDTVTDTYGLPRRARAVFPGFGRTGNPSGDSGR